MLHIDRLPEPQVFRSKFLEQQRARARQFFTRPSAQKMQTRFAFFLPGIDSRIQRSLWTVFRGKCAYCEQPLDRTGYYNVDSFRPKKEALNLDGQASPLHYWWLAYEWTNLYLACAVCNKLKGSRFPVEGRRAAIGGDISVERPLLLDPCIDFPEHVLLFDEHGAVASEDDRGRTTIEVLGLNRRDLLASRSKTLLALRKDWDKVKRSLLGKSASVLPFRKLLDPSRPFAAMTRQYVQCWGRELREESPATANSLRSIDAYRTALPDRVTSASDARRVAAQVATDFKKAEREKEKFSVEDDNRKIAYYSRSQLIERIEIHNFRVLRDVCINVPLNTQDRGSWLLLLGENATGKTSVLQAVALALTGPGARKRLARRIDPSSYLRNGCSSGYVKVFLTGQTLPIELELRSRPPYLRSTDTLPKVLLLGYGATRLIPRIGARHIEKPGASKVDNLFDPFFALSDGVPWLYNLAPGDFHRIARSLKELLPNGERVRLLTKSTPKRHLRASDGRSSVPLHELSAGYSSVVSLAMDIMSVMRLRWDAMENAEGMVLIDEIDAHLHPQWKMQIVDKLRRVFPRLQFIVTSHEPLTLRGLHEGEVAVMQRGQDGNISVLTELPSPRALRIDQILTSDFFGLNSTADPQTDELFQRYYDLLAIRTPSADDKLEIARLRKELDGRELLGQNRRERLMLEAADRFLAEEKAEPRAASRLERREKVESQLQAMWSSVDE